MHGPSYHTPYCLHCYAPMRSFRGASATCDWCGRVNVKEDQRLFWTRERKLREIEGLLKGAVLLLVSALTAVMLSHPEGGSGSGHGMAIGLPILLGVLLWDAASGITHRRSSWRGGLVWAIVLGTLGTVALFLGVAELGHRPADGGVVVLLSVLLFALALGILSLGRSYRRWAVRRIVGRQAERPLDEGYGSSTASG